MSAVTTEGKTHIEVTPPDWVTDTKMQAAFRKLPADERDRLEALPDDQRRGSVRQAAIAAGIANETELGERFTRFNGKQSATNRTPSAYGFENEPYALTL
jgi:hypothetical protein